jgi:hypothetical protein
MAHIEKILGDSQPGNGGLGRAGRRHPAIEVGAFAELDDVAHGRSQADQT